MSSGTPAPGATITPQPGNSPTVQPGGGGATPTPRPGGNGPLPPRPVARPVPQLPTPESFPGYGMVTIGMCATDHRTGRGKLVFTSGSDGNDPTTYRVTLRWTYEGKPEARCEQCSSSARYEHTENV